MLFNRTKACVAAGLMVLLFAAPGFGQGPLGLQLFAPADNHDMGTGPEPNEGYFFQFDGLYWAITPPDTKVIGVPGLTRNVAYGPHPYNVLDPLSDIQTESNTLDTSQLKAQFSVGDRFEFGRIEDRNGWFMSIFQVRDQSEQFLIPAANVVFNDPPFGPHGEQLLEGPVGTTPAGATVIADLPVYFTGITMTHWSDTWGVELNYLHRQMTNHNGGTFEFFAGARYFEFNDNFAIHTATDAGGGTVPSFLGGSSWTTYAQNHIVGPQIGLRWFKKQGRWMLSTEGRFFAGLNAQNIQQQIDLGPNLTPAGSGGANFQPSVMNHTTATHDAFPREFSPGVELRVEGRYQITQAVSFHAGWTGFWIDNIARANSVIDYTVPSMGINLADGANKQDVLMNGVTIGFDVNR